MQQKIQSVKQKQAWAVILLMLVSFLQLRAGDSITVYIFLSETCPICQSQTLALRQLYDEYAGKGITFMGMFPNAELSTDESIRKFGRKYKLDFSLKRDEQQQLTNKLQATITPQVFVLNNHTQQVVYRGKIDNSYEGIGKRRQVITEHYLKDALQATLEKEEPPVKETAPVGCFIIKPD